MGTGTYATQCRRYFGDMYIEGVEIDEKITALAHKYFELPDDIKVVTYDGRAYLSALAKMKEAGKAEAFDVIMVDAYQDITIPFQMSSAEFFSLVKEMLADDGVMVVNMNMQDNSGQGINDYLSDTIASVFGEVYTVNVSAGTNRELFAGNISDLPGRMAANLEKEENEELVRLMTRVSSGLSRYENKDLVMTDDKAPVELLGMKAIDGIIADEVGYYKKIYETEGFKGVIDMLFE